MKLLLDTHTFLWLLSEPSQLPSLVLEAIASSENMLLVSVVSLWEATIKSAKGSLILPGSDIGSVASAIQKRGITILAFEVEDLAELETLPLLHKDPFDRALIAQARRHGATLVTVDRALSSYKVNILWK